MGTLGIFVSGVIFGSVWTWAYRQLKDAGKI